MQDRFAGSGRDVDVGPHRKDAFWGCPSGTGLPLACRAAVVGTLFEWGRGVEPLRVAVGPQRSGLLGQPRVSQKGQWATPFREPMPVTF